VDAIVGRDPRISKLQPGDGRVIAALLSVLAITALFWTAQTQVWNSYPLWVRDQVDRQLLGFTIPVTWFQSLDSFAVLALSPLVLWLWRRQSQRGSEPGDLIKIAMGCAFFSFACVLLTIGEWLSGDAPTSLVWPTAFHFACAAAYLYTAPTALALVSRAAPASVNAMMVGAYYLALFAGGIISGWLGRFFEVLSAADFWLLHATIVGSGTVLLVLLRSRLLRALKLEPVARARGA